MSLGPFTVDHQGLVQPAAPELFPSFSVSWRQRQVKARLIDRQDADETGHLEFTSKLGRIPSTAAPPERACQRDEALRLLSTLPGLVPEGWAMRLSPDHSVVFATTTSVRFPISAVSLITLVTEQLLALAPYLDVLDEAGVDGLGVDRPVGAATGLGMVNT